MSGSCEKTGNLREVGGDHDEDKKINLPDKAALSGMSVYTGIGAYLS